MKAAEAVRAGTNGTAPPKYVDTRGTIATTAVYAVVLALFFFAVSAIFGNNDAWDFVGAFVIGPALFVFTIPILQRQAKREGDSTLMTLLIAALILKLLGSIARYVLAIDLYQGKNDAIFYDHIGGQLADSFRAGDFSLHGAGATGSEFIELLTGLVYTIIGQSIVGGFLFFSWLGFLGLFFFYRAFTIAVPEGRKRTYARFVFFLPSLLFWPSSIGKESWMMFTLGITALGAAHFFSGKTWKGLALAALGLWWAALPRPHIAALAGVGIGAGTLVRRVKKGTGFGPLIKLGWIAVVAVAAVFFISQASSFLKDAGIDTSSGLTTALEDTADRASGGKSTIEAPVLNSPGQAPIAIFTVLYRPTIADAASPQALLASAEGTFLFLLAIWRFRWWLAAARLVRRRPYVLFSMLMVGMLIFAFSTIGNLGILARERVQLIPFYLVLFSIPPPKRRRPEERGPEDDDKAKRKRKRTPLAATAGA